MGNSAVPTHWYPYTLENGNYLNITKSITSTSMKQHLRAKFLQYWAVTYEVLPTVTDGQGTLPPPEDDSEAVPVPPVDDSQAAPVSPTDEAQMPVVIGF